MKEGIDEILQEYKGKGFLLDYIREVRSGKEATVHLVNLNGRTLALKVYKDPEERTFQNNSIYLEGKHFKNLSERKAILKKNKFGKGLLHTTWIKREFYLLRKLKELGVTVPGVVESTSTSMLMQFIGDIEAAPRLIDVKLTPDQARRALEVILKDMALLLEYGIVHGDLSAYNLLWWQDKPYIIDLPQAIDIRNNPNKTMLLKRDLDNIVKYFNKIITVDEKVINQYLTID